MLGSAVTTREPGDGASPAFGDTFRDTRPGAGRPDPDVRCVVTEGRRAGKTGSEWDSSSTSAHCRAGAGRRGRSNLTMPGAYSAQRRSRAISVEQAGGETTRLLPCHERYSAMKVKVPAGIKAGSAV